MDATVLFSHGSLLCGAGEALRAHVERLRAQGLTPFVTVGYLNYSEPPFIDAVAECVAAGATRIFVTPYFLIPGYFVKVDLPKAVAEAQAQFPQVEFVVAQAIGFDERLADALIESANAAFGRKAGAKTCAAPRSSAVPAPNAPSTEPPTAPNTPLQSRRNRTRELPHCMLPCPNRLHYSTAPAGRCRCGWRSSIARNNPCYKSSREERRRELDTKTALLVMVHGSPRPIANAEMFRVVETVKGRGAFPIVEVGFMECNEPTIPEAIAACIVQGATEVIAVPYFLHTGKHVADDLPTLIEEAMARYPNITFRMGDYLGRSERLTDILMDRTHAALTV